MSNLDTFGLTGSGNLIRNVLRLITNVQMIGIYAARNITCVQNRHARGDRSNKSQVREAVCEYFHTVKPGPPMPSVITIE